MTTRTADPRILPAIVDRWSPRSFDGQPVPAQDLATIFEAAGLAPSAFNFQPWRFLYAVKGDAHWDAFLDILIPFNQGWAASAGALVFIISTQTSTAADGTTSPLYSHSFDAGAAWGLLALQATALGYQTHGMTGIDFDKARSVLGIPEGWRVEAATVIGKLDSADKLPDFLAAREHPGTRKPVAEVAVAGPFAALPA